MEKNKESNWQKRLETIFEETLDKVLLNRKIKAKLNQEELKQFGVQDFDLLVPDVLKMIVETNEVSTAKVQGKFGLGYARASRIIDQLEACGFITEPNSEKSRKVLITLEEYKNIFEKE